MLYPPVTWDASESGFQSVGNDLEVFISLWWVDFDSRISPTTTWFSEM